jgi:predicted GNAT superfamily acetyltransferase
VDARTQTQPGNRHGTPSASTADSPPNLSHRAAAIRRIETWGEYEACVALQRDVWGAEFTECVPAAILMVTQRIGGVVAGAFDHEGQLIGFVFGMTGVERGRLVHWSDMLAVRSSERGRGIGRQLKMFQREAVRAVGVETMYWTFDPLVARNARLNLVTLGAAVVDYVPDMYGHATTSTLHQGLGTDRFIAAWHVGDGARPRSVTETTAAQCADVLILNAMAGIPDGAPAVRITIPLHIDRVQRHSLTAAGRWRTDTRRAFLWCFEHGYHVTGYYRDEPSETAGYILTPAAALHPPTPTG